MFLPIVLDTNIIMNDWRLTKPLFRTLIGLMPVVEGEFWLPEVVFQETVKHYREQIGKVINDANRAVRTFTEMTGRDVDVVLNDENVQSAVEDYEVYLRDKTDSLGGAIFCTESVPHDVITKWAVEKRKPFKQNGAGYADALIWATVLELCRIHDPGSVIFITDNLTDFYDNEKTGLHPDLQADIDALGECNFKRLHIFRGVAQFIESTCGPAVQRWEEVNKAFGRGERGGDVFRAGLFDFLSQELKNTIWNASVIGIYSTAAEIGVLDVRTLPYFELRPPYEVSNGELLVRVEAKVGIDFEGRIDRQLWHELRHVPPMHTVDSETFPSRVHFFGARVVPVEVYFTLNKATRVTSEYELVSLGGEPPIHPEEDE